MNDEQFPYRCEEARSGSGFSRTMLRISETGYVRNEEVLKKNETEMPYMLKSRHLKILAKIMKRDGVENFALKGQREWIKEQGQSGRVKGYLDFQGTEKCGEI